MGFRIHRGIFQKLNAERTAYENTFKIDDDGRIKEVDANGNVTSGYLKVGEQASDADTVDGIQAGSFLRSDADDTASGNITFSGTMYFTDAANNNRLNKGASFVNLKDPWSNFHVRAGQGQMYLDSAAYHIRPQNGSTDWLYITSDYSEFNHKVYADNGLHVRGDWVRVDGSNGIYFESYGGGWRMTDSSWIRAYNDKNIYTGGSIEVAGTIRADNGFKVDGSTIIDGSGTIVGNVNNNTTTADYFIQEPHGNPRNNLGSPTVTEMALFDSQFRCMTDLSNNYTDLDRLTFWVQQNEGDAWTEVTHSDTNKKRFLRTNSSGVVIPNRAYKFRVEFKAPGYVFANALYFYWSSNSHSTKVHVYKYNASQDTWHAHATSNTNVSSWPGHLYLPFSTIPWHETHTTSTGHHRYIRVEFIPNWSTGSYADRDINLYGGQIWGGYPSGRRTVHSINEDGNYYFPANLYAEGGSGDGSRLATRDWVGSNTLNQTEGDARYLGISAKAADANLLDGIDSGSFLRSDANDTFSGILTGSGAGENLKIGGIRGTAKGSQAGQYIHLYERVHIGGPSGWGAATHGAPGQGLSTWGSVDFGMNGSGVIQLNGTTIVNASRELVNVRNTNWDTAYEWGNHASAGYLTSVPSEYLTQTEGDARYLQSLPAHNHDSLYHKLDFDAVTSAGRPDAESGTWVKTVSTTDWGSYKVGTDADAGRAYNDAPGYVEYNIPSGYSTAYIGQLKWSSGGYFDVHAKKTDGSLVHRGRYLSKQSIENSSHGGDHDGQQIIKVSGLDGMAAIRITNLVGRVHLQGIGWTKELDTDGTQDSTTHWDLINGKPSTFAPSSHNHDSRYYTETEMDTKLAAKANSSHTHSYNDLNDLPTIPSNNNQLTNGAGYITGSGNTSGYAGQLSDRGGYGNNSFSFNQESGTFAGYTGWANYFIGNHGDGATYYNTVHIMPFWGVPQYSRLEGGTFRGPWTYWTTENMSQATVNTWNTAYGWGNHASAGYVTSVSDALGYTPYQEGTALSTTTISATNKISLNGGHSTARVVIKYNHNGDDTSENSGNLVMWTSEPGISYASSGIGGNIHESGHYYGKRNANIPYGVALRFNVASGRAEFLMTNSTNNGSFGVGWYVDDRGNTVQQGSITAPGYNNGNWDTAYGWGNHASAGYLTLCLILLHLKSLAVRLLTLVLVNQV